MIKLVASDMDGTFLKHGGVMPENAFEMIEALHEKGILFVIATGRQTKTVENDFEPVKDKIAIISENGAVLSYKGEEMSTYTIALEHAKAIAKEAKAVKDSFVVMCCRDVAYYPTQEKIFTDAFIQYYHSSSYQPDFEQITDEKVVKLALYHPEDVTLTLEPHLREKWASDFKITVSGKNWVDVGRKDTNKGLALATLREKLGIKKEETMAFGDYFNDVEMLQEAGESYAMEHALEGVKKHARFIAPTDGVIDIIYSKLLK
jgi:hypothetical protein